MNKTIKREKLVANFNQQMALDTNAHRRVELKNIYSNILMDMDIYGGFQYVDWARGGWAQWKKDGSPADNTKYLGDQTKIKFI